MTGRRFTIGVALVAVGAATFAIAFRTSLSVLYRTVYHADNVVDAVAALPSWLRLVVPLAGAGAAGMIARVRATPAQGVSNVMEAVALGNVQLSLRTTASRGVSSWAAIAGGMSIGREGPLIFELSGDYPIVLPLLVATVVSTSVSRRLSSESVYESELRRRGLGWDLTLEGRRMKVPPPGASTADE